MLFDEELPDLDSKKSGLKKRLLENLINLLDVDDENKDADSSASNEQPEDESSEENDNPIEETLENDTSDIPEKKARVSIVSVNSKPALSSATEKKLFKKLKG